MVSIEQEILSVQSQIQDVVQEIKDVARQLEAQNLSDEDKQYLRQKENLLRQKEDRLRHEKLLLMQKPQPLSAIPEKETVELEQVESRKMLEEIYQSLVNGDRATPQKTPASHGKDELCRLQREGKVKTFTSVDSELPILSSDENMKLSELGNEHHVVAFITPHLEKIFGQNDDGSTTVVVNSEEHRWLQTSDDSTFGQKPDLFVCHRAIYQKRQPFKTRDPIHIKMRGTRDAFGVLADWKLRRFLYVVCEAKMKIDNTGLGETINYGSHICFEDGPVTVRLILFDRNEFWLVECVKGVASSIEKCCWSQCGSASLMRNFALRDPLIEALDDACKAFHLTIDENSFLGQGAFGVVFRVKNQEGKLFAMKIVSDEGNHVQQLKIQAEVTNRAKTICPQYIVGIESNGFLHYEDKAGVLLQSDVGRHYSTLSKTDIIQALEALHSKNILHGDCRVENIVNVNGNARWIDMRAGRLFESMDISEDKEQEKRELLDSIERAFPSTE